MKGTGYFLEHPGSFLSQNYVCSCKSKTGFPLEWDNMPNENLVFCLHLMDEVYKFFSHLPPTATEPAPPALLSDSHEEEEIPYRVCILLVRSSLPNFSNET